MNTLEVTSIGIGHHNLIPLRQKNPRSTVRSALCVIVKVSVALTMPIMVVLLLVIIVALPPPYPPRRRPVVLSLPRRPVGTFSPPNPHDLPRLFPFPMYPDLPLCAGLMRLCHQAPMKPSCSSGVRVRVRVRVCACLFAYPRENVMND